MKRPAKATQLDPNSPHSAVYLAARREWNERYGDYIAQANNWRLIAIAALGVAAVAVAGNVWQSSQSRVQPFVVEVDKLGDALAIQRADVAAPIPVGVIRAQLARYIQNVRTVSIDVQAERAFITEAYAMVDKNSGAPDVSERAFRGKRSVQAGSERDSGGARRVRPAATRRQDMAGRVARGHARPGRPPGVLEALGSHPHDQPQPADDRGRGAGQPDWAVCGSVFLG